ncbi:MAG: AAA family ATPase [Labrys sp. (in: a-proteobacteria)]
MTEENYIEDKPEAEPEVKKSCYKEAVEDSQYSKRNGHNLVPFIGTKDEYEKLYLAHKEFLRDSQMGNPRFVPEDHPWLFEHVYAADASEILARDLPVRETLVHPWMRQGDAVMLYAPPGLGKSFLSMTLALAVAGGGTIKGLGWEVHTPKKVLYIDGEMPVADIKERLELITEGNWIDGLDKELALKNLVILSALDQAVGSFSIDLTNKPAFAGCQTNLRRR